IRAGSTARGSVIGVRGKRLLGIGGKVVFKLDSVELVTGTTVGLRAHKEVKGSSHTWRMVAEMVVTGLFYLPAAPIFLLSRGGNSTVLSSTEITAQINGEASLLAADLPRAAESASGVNDAMENLPPRVFDGEGREGDMVNLIFIAQDDDLRGAFERGGWVKTDEWKPVMAWHLLSQRTHDAKLPMARFYMFGRVQDYSYALPDPAAIMSRRHHLRIWKTEYTLDGDPIWAGAASHDVAIEIGKRGHLINHAIDPYVDTERDFIGTNLTETSLVHHQEYLHCMEPVFQAQTASGEAYYSDSRILLLDLHEGISTQPGVSGQSTASVRAISLPIGTQAESFQSSLTSPF